ncbi:MAG: radical SAM/SPASM domain-containing protein [Endomicrobiaceae bacterium]
MEKIDEIIRNQSVKYEDMQHIKSLLEYLNKCSDYEKLSHITSELLKFFPQKYVKEYNIILNEYEIAEKKTILKSYPRYIRVMPTSLCDLDCIMCHKDKPFNISENMKKEVFKLMPYLEKIIWMGGEVFIYKGFEEMLDIGYKNSLFQEITTNAQNISEFMAEKLVRYNVNMIISVDSADAKIYEYIRRNGSFKKLCDNLSFIKKYRDLYKSKNPMALNVVVMKSTYKGLPEILKFASSYGFSEICLILGTASVPKEEDLLDDLNRSSIPELKKIVDDLINNQEGINIRNLIPFDILGGDKKEENNIHDEKLSGGTKEKEKFFCRVPWKYMFVSAKGIFPECYCDPGQPVGDAGKDSLFEVWNGEKMQQYRKNLICDDRSICAERCYSGFLADYKKL